MNASPPDILAHDLGTSAAAIDVAVLLENVLARSGDCIKILDLQGRLQFMSEGGKKVMEVDNFGALKGCSWPDFWPDRAAAADAVAAAIDGRPSHFRGPANTARGTPKYWDVTVSPIIGHDGKTTHILSVSRDITAEWREAERQKFLTAELQHRVKNMMTAVIAIARQTFKGATHETARGAFVERLEALNRAHSLLSETNWHDARVGDVVAGALAFHSFEKDAVSCDGPALDIGPQQALALALAVNELATNALKYGALKTGAGRVDISWDTSGGQFRWLWRESGGAPVKAPDRTGFGARVIRDMLASEFGGVSELDFAPEGLACTLTAPLNGLTKQ